MSEKSLIANCRSQVIAKIDSFLPSVPNTLDERKKCQKEWCCIKQIFKILPENQFSYPIEITHRESPDFVICMPDRKIGVECVESVDEARMAARRDLEKSGQYPEVYPVPHIPSGTPKNERPELARKQMTYKIHTPPWHGSESEREWVIAINKILDKKKNVFDNDSFSKFNENWLFINSNYNPSDVNVASCMRNIVNYIECKYIDSSYNRVFIEKSKLIYNIERINGILCWVIYS